MWLASWISWKMGFCAPEVPRRIEGLLRGFGHLGPLPFRDPSGILALLALDKKGRGGRALFVLTRKIGAVSMKPDVPKRLILQALNLLRRPTIHFSGQA
jgi:3-dehydroquinate synthetase